MTKFNSSPFLKERSDLLEQNVPQIKSALLCTRADCLNPKCPNYEKRYQKPPHSVQVR